MRTEEETSNVLELKQIVIEGTSLKAAELANEELLLAYSDLSRKALMVMGEPTQAREAIYAAQRRILTAMQHLIDPLSPCHAKSIQSAAAANGHLESALFALDSEVTNKFIEDAIVSVAQAIKAVQTAREALKPKNSSVPSRRVTR